MTFTSTVNALSLQLLGGFAKPPDPPVGALPLGHRRLLLAP